jgi:hypothetical protein
MIITVTNSAAANAGPDQTVCGTSAITLAGNVATGGNWVGGVGTFSPNRNTANAIYTPSLAEIGTTVTLTWNVPDPDGTGPCTSGSDAMLLTINTNTIANAGPDQNVCGNSTVFLIANTVSGGNWTGGAGTFNPNRTTANATYTPAISEFGTTVTLILECP